jgi:hypothetical protein
VKIQKIISLVRNGLFQILFLLSVPSNIKELFKNSVRKKYVKKVAIGKFATFLTPFQASSTKICLQVKSSQFHMPTMSKRKMEIAVPLVSLLKQLASPRLGTPVTLL